MAVREYSVRGYRNTGYKPGIIGQVEFDRPLSQATLEALYPTGDSDILELQDLGSKFLLRSLYYKQTIKVRHTGTQKDIIHQVDYLRIKANEGGADAEVAYFFVDASKTQWVGADTVVLYLALDEQTTANASQTLSMGGIIDKRTYANSEPLNFYNEDWQPVDQLKSDLDYVTVETGAGFTLYTTPSTPVVGSRTLVPVFCSVSKAGQANPEVKSLPAGADKVTFTIVGISSSFSFTVDNMAFVDPNNSVVKEAFTYLRSTGNESMIGTPFTIPNQILDGEPTVVMDGTVPLITAIRTKAFGFTIDDTAVVPEYGGVYAQLKNKKAGYHWLTYTMTAPASGDSKGYSLRDIVASTTQTSDLTTSQLKFLSLGIPLPSGSQYFRPYLLSNITQLNADIRSGLSQSIRGADWRSDGLVISGMSNEYFAAHQVQQAKAIKDINDAQVSAQYALTKSNIAKDRLSSTLGLGQGVAGIVGGAASKSATGVLNGIVAMGASLLKRTGAGMGAGGELQSFGDIYDQQDKIAERQYEQTMQLNNLGIADTQWSFDYAKSTQSLAVQPPTGMDMTRVLGNSLQLTTTYLSNADVIRYDEWLTYYGTSVFEPYTGLLKDHPKLLSNGTEFCFVKLGTCTIKLPGEKSGWANSLAWRQKIQAELQTGGRYWKTKTMAYEWKPAIPTDGGYEPEVRPELESVVITVAQPTIGSILGVTVAPVGSTYTLEWFANGIKVGSGATYTVKTGDLYKTITAKATGYGEYQGAKLSAGVYVNLKTFTVTLDNTTPKVGDKVTAVTDPLDARTKVNYQWYVDGVPVDPTDPSKPWEYVVRPEDLGKKIECKVTAKPDQGYEGEEETPETDPVKPEQFVPDFGGIVTSGDGSPLPPNVLVSYTLAATLEVLPDWHYLLWTAPPNKVIVQEVDGDRYNTLATYTHENLYVLSGGTYYPYPVGLVKVGATLELVRHAPEDFTIKVYNALNPTTAQVYPLRPFGGTGYMGTLVGSVSYDQPQNMYGDSEYLPLLRFLEGEYQYTKNEFRNARNISITEGSPAISQIAYQQAGYKNYYSENTSLGSIITGDGFSTIYTGWGASQQYNLNWHCTEDYTGYAADANGVFKLRNLKTLAVIDDTVTGSGAVYKTGLYIQRGSSWFFRYNDGTEYPITSTLPEYWGTPWWTKHFVVHTSGGVNYLVRLAG